MKKDVIILVFLLGIFLALPLVLAQEQVQPYSSFDRFVDNVKLVFSSGDSDVRLALEIREKEVNSAMNNFNNGEEDKVVKDLERAKEKLQIVQEKVSLNTSEEIKTSVEEVITHVKSEENLPEEFEEYLLEEEKTQLTAVLTEKTYEYCKELAKEDFALMLKDEECNPDTAIPGLEKELEKLKDLQLRMFVQLMLEIRSCIDDPGTCNCEVNVDVEQKAKCEKMVALAIKCEYKEDETSCNELESMRPKQGDSFAESFVPGFLKNLFKEKEYMIEYGIEPSDCVPEECWDNNDKPECKQYDSFKETKEDWDEYGNFVGTKNKCGTKGQIPTMQESIPQCFDGDIFLEEKCGKITMVENEDGLINYIIENEINGILAGFENKSEQNIIDVNGAKGQMGGENLTIDGEQNQVGNKAWEIKQEMNQINNQIANITYAAGTGPGGNGGVVIDGDKQGVVTGGGGGNDVDNVVVDGDGSNGGYAPGTSGNSPGNTVVDGGGNTVDTGTVDVDNGGGNTVDVDNGGGNTVDVDNGGGGNTVDTGTVDVDNNGDSGNGGGNDVGGIDDGSGEPGEVDED